MRTELSSLDLHYLVEEFQVIVNGKIDKIFQNKNVFLFQIHVTGKGKQFLKIILPGFIFIGEEKQEQDNCDKFGLDLRKHITGARIRNIAQREFERIIEIDLDAKERAYKLLIELFRPGNMILCDKDDKIILGYSYKGFGSRMIRPGIAYEYPKKEYNLLTINEKDIVKILSSSDKSSVVISLAVNLGLGGVYSEEACLLAGIDKKKTSLDDKEIISLFDAIRKIGQKKIDARAYSDDKGIVDISPFEMQKYYDLKFEKIQSLNHALDMYLSAVLSESKKRDKFSKYENEKKKLESIKKNQEMQIKGFEDSAKESQRKGELIYEKYQEIKKAVDEINAAKLKYSWEELSKKLKKNNLVKEINPKDKKIILEF